MITVVGVRYKRAGRLYYFDPNGLELHIGDNVVVDTARGPVLATVTQVPKEVADEEVVQPLKPVLRVATYEDIKAAEGLKEKEDKALFETAAIIKKLNLPMNLITAEYNLDMSRLTIYFGAEGRVDFRELVKELNRTLRTLVELRQIGPRDEAKLIGGYGRCGRQLCCEGFLTDFHPVSIKMAKEQNLPLNSTKISGVCGRLLCCLGYEYDQYKSQNKRMPKRGSVVETPSGEAVVMSAKPMEELVTVKTQTDAILEFPLHQIKLGGHYMAEFDGDEGQTDGVLDEDILHDEMVEYTQDRPILTTENSRPRQSRPQTNHSRYDNKAKTKVGNDIAPKEERSAETVDERKNRNYRRRGNENRQQNKTNENSQNVDSASKEQKPDNAQATPRRRKFNPSKIRGNNAPQ